MKEPTKSPAPADNDEDKAKAKAKATVEAISDDDVAKAVEDAVEGLRGKADRAQVVNALRTAAELANRDENWGK